MEPHQERVIAEQKDLSDKIGKLETFIRGDIFANIAVDEQVRLYLQLHYMRSYDEVLVARIDSF